MEEKKEKAKGGNTKYIIGVIVLVVLIIAIYSIVPTPAPLVTTTTNTIGGNTTGGGTAGSSLDVFAKCLTAKGVKMYGAYWCPHCQAQKDMFGEAFQYVDYVECEGAQGNPSACAAAGIQGYPTWIINGKKLEGEQSFDGLATESGCTLQQ